MNTFHFRAITRTTILNPNVKNLGIARCSKVKLTDAGAIAALQKFILEPRVYKLAEDYYLVM